MEVIEKAQDEWFSIQNYVCTGELGENLNLNALGIALGLEKTEYEPEQFPGLIYRPEDSEGVVLLFASGRVVITGCRSVENANSIFSELSKTLADLI